MKSQSIKYKCCGQIFAACCEPECYTDKEWLKDLRKHALKGNKVEVIENDDIQFGRCKCEKKEDYKPAYLFSYADTNEH